MVAVLLYGWWMNESEGTCSDVAGLSSQSHYPVKKKRVTLFFPTSMHFLWDLPMTWQIVYHPHRALFLRLKPRKLWFGILLRCLMRILKLDISRHLRLNYVSHDAPWIAPSFLEQAKKVSLVFHGKYFISHRKMITWNNKDHGKIFYIVFALFFFPQLFNFLMKNPRYSWKQFWNPNFHPKIEWIYFKWF